MGKKALMCDCEIVHSDKVENAQKNCYCKRKLALISKFYKALADSTRIKIISFLLNNELCVCDISYLLNMTKSATCHQLKYLLKNGIVKSRRTGKEVYYSLNDEHVEQVFEISIKHVEELDNEDKD